MPFRVALSGLNAASADLNVTANNIANASTNGFKTSRAEFADVFAVGAQEIGNGVRLGNVSQTFSGFLETAPCSPPPQHQGLPALSRMQVRRAPATTKCAGG